jgi:hypothetical protein
MYSFVVIVCVIGTRVSIHTVSVVGLPDRSMWAVPAQVKKAFLSGVVHLKYGPCPEQGVPCGKRRSMEPTTRDSTWRPANRVRAIFSARPHPPLHRERVCVPICGSHSFAAFDARPDVDPIAPRSRATRGGTGV